MVLENRGKDVKLQEEENDAALIIVSEQRNNICQHFFAASSVSAKRDRFYWHPHFGNEEIGSEKVRLPKVRVLEKGRARVQA